jgi:hypothetical protein
LVRQAKLRSIISDVDQIKVAVNSFFLQYAALPGDMTDASSYWSSCITESDDSSNTCDGNGNKSIARNYEGVRAWQHMYLAGIIPDNLTGIFDTAGQFDIGVNIKESRIAGSGYFLWRVLNSIGNKNWIFFSKFRSGNYAQGSALKPAEAYNLDLKVDDGIRNKGSVGAEKGAESGTDNCHDDSNNYKYKLSHDNISCISYFDIGL